MRYVPEFLVNRQVETIRSNIQYYEKLTRDPRVTPTQIRLYWRILRQLREDLANQRGI